MVMACILGRVFMLSGDDDEPKAHALQMGQHMVQLLSGLCWVQGFGLLTHWRITVRLPAGSLLM